MFSFARRRPNHQRNNGSPATTASTAIQMPAAIGWVMKYDRSPLAAVKPWRKCRSTSGPMSVPNSTGTSWKLYRSMKNPMTASAAATTRSNQLSRNVYTPAQQIATTAGSRIQLGTRSTATHSRIRLTLSNNSITLPMSNEAMSPQNRSGLVLTSCGPGWMPWTCIATNMTASVPENGSPNDSSGIINDVAAALLADSGPASPDTAPLPNFLRSRPTIDSRR